MQTNSSVCQCPNFVRTHTQWVGGTGQRRLLHVPCNRAHSGMLQAMDEVLLEQTERAMRNSLFISVTMDESTDVSMTKKLDLNVKTVENSIPKVHFAMSKYQMKKQRPWQVNF